MLFHERSSNKFAKETRKYSSRLSPLRNLIVEESKKTDREKKQPWIPERVNEVLSLTKKRESINLKASEIIGKHFVNESEIQDVYDIITQIKNPIFIGLHGSRAHLPRPPLFANVENMDSYYAEKANRMEKNLEGYLEKNEGISLAEYYQARRYLQNRFNRYYQQGQQYPESIVRLLVRDIDMLIITEDAYDGGPKTGKRTKIQLDIGVCSPYHPFATDPEDLEHYLQFGLQQTIPVIY